MIAATQWREGQRIGDIAYVLWPSDCVQRFAAVFYSYFDESWDQHQEKILVFGGMIGRYEQWAKIEWRWKALLNEYGIDYYRASEAEFARGEFKKEPYRTGENPSTPEQRALLARAREDFFQIITKGMVSGLAIGIPIKYFYEVLDTPEKLAKFDNTPYYLCGHISMLRIMKAVKSREELNSKELVAFIFDTQKEFEKEMGNVHSRLQTKECEFNSQVGTLTYADKRRFIPLQVADTLAYECRKYLERKFIDASVKPRLELQRLMDEGKIFEITLCEQECVQWYLEHHIDEVDQK
jgi:hypothetical protein